jgi:6,7-dimethyl-8-ribityllumazine synthase
MSEHLHSGVRPELTDGQGLRIAVVTARFNEHITRELRKGAVEAIDAHGASLSHDVWVPGAFELPLVAKQLALKPDVDAVVVLGCVIRGDTTHYDYVCSGVTQGVMSVSLETGVPLGFGVLTTENVDQAIARIQPDTNKGAEAALTVIEVVRRLEAI